MRKMKLNQKALRRTASGTPVDNRIFKPTALAKAIAGVFVCGVLTTGDANAVPGTWPVVIEVGGYQLSATYDSMGGTIGYVGYDGAFQSAKLVATEAPTTWSFRTSDAFANLSDGGNDIDLSRATWDALAKGGTSSFINDTDKTIIFSPKDAISPYGAPVFKTVATNNGTARIENSGNGLIEIQGSMFIEGITAGATERGTFELVNSGEGVIKLTGGQDWVPGGEMTSVGRSAVSVFADGAMSSAKLVNSGGGLIDTVTGLGGVSPIGAFAKNGATVTVENLNGSKANLVFNGLAFAGSCLHMNNDSNSTLVLSESRSSFKIDSASLEDSDLYIVNEGKFSIDSLWFKNSDVDIDNNGLMEFNAEENLFLEGAGSFVLKNRSGGVFILNNEMSCYPLILFNGQVTIENDGEVHFLGGQCSGMDAHFGAGEIRIKNNGSLYFDGGYYLVTQQDALLDISIDNRGYINFGVKEIECADGELTKIVINNYGVVDFTNGEGNFSGYHADLLFNKIGSELIGDAAVFFSGNYSKPELGTESAQKSIYVIGGDGSKQQINSQSFVENALHQTGNLVLDNASLQYVVFDAGSTILISDVAADTELAKSIEEQLRPIIGNDVNIRFTGTVDGQPASSSKFNMDVVNALISENKLAAGSVVTSEALTHEGKTFTLGNTGDMTQDTGFMGILGSSGITVKDGKTLTLMGAQASMAMAVGADDRAASYVMTDAPTTLQNGTLNLGHKALSATEGTLADVTFDRMSTVNVENGIYTLASLKGEGSLNLSTGTRTDVTGELSATQVTNAGTLTVAGQTVLGAAPEGASTYTKPNAQTFVNENGATANLIGGLVVNDFAKVSNKTGSTMNAGAVVVDTFGQINNYAGATLTYASVDADGIVRNQGTLNVTGTYVVGDEGETTLDGESTIGTLAVGRTSKLMLLARNGDEAEVFNRGKTYVDELDLVSGTISVEKDSVLAGKSLKNGAVGSDITVAAGGTFAFSHDKSSLDNALKNFTGDKDGKAILTLSTDLHFGQGGSLTVGTVEEAKGTVNLGSDALLLLGTTQLHGEALLNGESSQHLHVEDGAVIAMTDDLLWGNHYLMKGFDDASTAEILKVGILDKDGKALGTKKNDKGIFVTVGSDNILEKDKSYRMVNQMNWLLDGRQDLTSVHGDVAFLTNALVDKNGALATNRMEALAADSSALAETQRMGAQVQTTMLDHASSARKGYGTFWVDGIYSKTDSGDFTRSTGAYGYEADTTGFAFGADLPMGDDTWRLGAAFSAQRGDLDGSYGLSSDIEGYGFSVYGGKSFFTGLNLSGALTYMTANHEVDAYNLGKVKADIDADMWVLGARMSMPFGQNRVWMTPYLGVDVMKLTQDGFTSSWSGMDAFRYSDVDATIVRTPVGVRAGTFMPLELFGRSGTVNWDADISFIPQFGDKDADFKVSGISNGHSDGMSAEFVNDWLSQAKFGMSYQGAAGSFGLYYAVEKGDVRDWSSSVNAKASLFF